MRARFTAYCCVAALLATACAPERKSPSNADDDGPSNADYAALNRLLARPDGSACASQTVKNEIELIAIGELGSSSSGWTPEEASAFVDGYQSTITDVTLTGYDRVTKLTSCAAKYEASAGGEGWTIPIQYSIQPALDGPRPVITVTDTAPLRVVNNRLQNFYERDVVRPRQEASELADREAQIALNEQEAPELAVRARDGCAPQPTDELYQRCLIAQFRMLRAFSRDRASPDSVNQAQPSTNAGSAETVTLAPGPRRPGPTSPQRDDPLDPNDRSNRARTSATLTPRQMAAMFGQVYRHWTVPCELLGAHQTRVQVDLELSRDGEIISGPTLVSPQATPAYESVADGALLALRQAAPFRVPSGFQGGKFRPSFNVEHACRNR